MCHKLNENTWISCSSVFHVLITRDKSSFELYCITVTLLVLYDRQSS